MRAAVASADKEQQQEVVMVVEQDWEQEEL